MDAHDHYLEMIKKAHKQSELVVKAKNKEMKAWKAVGVAGKEWKEERDGK